MKILRRTLAPLTVLGLLFLATASVGGPSADTPSPATEANITKLTASLLEHSQFAHHPLDSELAGKFLDRYLDALDGGHSLLLQSDIAEFGQYRKDLAKVTRGNGDTAAAHAIFARCLQRLEERVDYVTKLLKTTKFDFTGHEE